MHTRVAIRMRHTRKHACARARLHKLTSPHPAPFIAEHMSLLLSCPLTACAPGPQESSLRKRLDAQKELLTGSVSYMRAGLALQGALSGGAEGTSTSSDAPAAGASPEASSQGQAGEPSPGSGGTDAPPPEDAQKDPPP